MIATKFALVAGVVLLAVFCGLAVAGFTPIVAPLVTVFILLLLIGGGSLLRGPRSSRGGPT